MDPASEVGATMVEYALMVALIAVVALAAATALGIDIAAIFADPDLADAFS